jgi:hypothetical protein
MNNYTSTNAFAGTPFIRQDFLQYYRYAQKWVDLFRSQPLMIRVETSHYIKGLHYLQNAHFDLRNYKQFAISLKQFETLHKPAGSRNTITSGYKLLFISARQKSTQHFMLGTFKEGLKAVPGIEEQLSRKCTFS